MNCKCRIQISTAPQIFRSIFSSYKELKASLKICEIEEEIQELEELAEVESSDELQLQIKEELEALNALLRQERLAAKPSDPNDSKNALIEIKWGTGGDESALFVADLYKMYENYCNSTSHFKLEALDFTPGNSGGFKEISFVVSGKNPYKFFKHESGCHRVQRVPKTETKGRVHTSIATVIVLPELHLEDVELNKHEVKVEAYNSGGKGGQHSNKTLNAARLIHLPTGITACSQMKSFPQNLKIAWAVLASRLNDHFTQQHVDSETQKRKEICGSGARSEKIRTYNFPQDRVTDHRSKTKYSLTSVLAGDIERLFQDLQLQ